MLEKSFAALLACCCTAALISCIPAASEIDTPAEPVAGMQAPPVATPTPVASTSEILGQWDIVSFDGYEPARLEGSKRAAFVDFGTDGVGLRIECNYSGASGRVVDGRFVASPHDGIQTAMGCGAEREARDAARFEFFRRGNPSVEHLSEGRLLLTAGDSRLLLERPAERRLAFLPSPQELLGEWRIVEITQYHEAGGYSGIGLGDTPGRIVFDGISAGYTRCPQYDLDYRYSKDGRIEKIDGPALPATPKGCAGLDEPMRGTDMPLPWDVMRVLHSNPMVEKTGEEEILLSTERYGVVLTKAKCESLEQSDDHKTTRVVDCASPR